jgi:hypothetical protein
MENAEIHFLFMLNLNKIDCSFGALGYRYDLINSGWLAQRICLGSEGLGIDCCGIGALYDLEAQSGLRINPDNALVYAVCSGPVKRGSMPEEI